MGTLQALNETAQLAIQLGGQLSRIEPALEGRVGEAQDAHEALVVWVNALARLARVWVAVGGEVGLVQAVQFAAQGVALGLGALITNSGLGDLPHELFVGRFLAHREFSGLNLV